MRPLSLFWAPAGSILLGSRPSLCVGPEQQRNSRERCVPDRSGPDRPGTVEDVPEQEAGEEPEESESERQPQRVPGGQIERDMKQAEDHRGYGQAVSGPAKPRHEPAEDDAAVRELLRDAVDQRLDEDRGGHGGGRSRSPQPPRRAAPRERAP